MVRDIACTQSYFFLVFRSREQSTASVFNGEVLFRVEGSPFALVRAVVTVLQLGRRRLSSHPFSRRAERRYASCFVGTYSSCRALRWGSPRRWSQLVSRSPLCRLLFQEPSPLR